MSALREQTPIPGSARPAAERLRRVLVVASAFPFPPTNGLALRTWAVVRSLAANGHEVHLLSFGDPDQPHHRSGEVLRFCREVTLVPHDHGSLSGRLDVRRRLRALFSTLPYGAFCSRSPGIRARIEECIAQHRIDAIVCEETQQLVNFPLSLPVPLVVDNHNAEFLLLGRYLAQERNPARAMYGWLERRKVRRWEQAACARADVALVCSDFDQSLFHALYPAARLVIAPNVVDAGSYPETPPAGGGAILYAGGMDWYPNRDAVEFFAFEILPHLKKAVAGPIQFVVAGRAPQPAFRRKFLSVPEMTFTGFVPDMRTEIARAAVCVVPLRIGSGTRLKILEAAAMGKPIVSTRIGAEGLGFAHGEDILLADTPRDFAGAVAGLLADPSRSRQIGRAARTRVEQQYSLANLQRALAEALGGAVPRVMAASR